MAPDYRVFRDAGGAVRKAWKHQSDIPYYSGFYLQDRPGLSRVQETFLAGPERAERIPVDFDEKLRVAIDAELSRRLSQVREGGFLLTPEHLITPGVPLADYLYHLDRVRQFRF